MRYVGAVSWLLATVVFLLAAGPAAGQFGDNVLVQGSPYGGLNSVYFDDSDRLYVLGVCATTDHGPRERERDR